MESSIVRDRVPVWSGPCSNKHDGGITQSMIARFLYCPERFRIRYILGLKKSSSFEKAIEYGQMFHAACERLASLPESTTRWDKLYYCEKSIEEYAASLCQRYPLQQNDVGHWMCVCKAQFPHYLDYWASHPDNVTRTPIYQEKMFSVPVKLQDGREVYLRGKWDGVDAVIDQEVSDTETIVLLENKTKGSVEEEVIDRQLTYDLQTNLYILALRLWSESDGEDDIKGRDITGVRYDVVRRPLSGGAGNIRPLKATKQRPMGESMTEYYARLSSVIGEAPDTYFFRWKANVSEADTVRFWKRTLSPILTRICDWYEWVKDKEDPFDGNNGLHWRRPYGVFSPEDNSDEVRDFLDTGSTDGLERDEDIFPELK